MVTCIHIAPGRYRRIVAPALAALDRVVADSELVELWGDADDAPWGYEADDLRARLVPTLTPRRPSSSSCPG